MSGGVGAGFKGGEQVSTKLSTRTASQRREKMRNSEWEKREGGEEARRKGEQWR